MSKKCSELLRAFDDIEYALSPDIVFDRSLEYNMRPMDIQL